MGIKDRRHDKEHEQRIEQTVVPEIFHVDKWCYMRQVFIFQSFKWGVSIKMMGHPWSGKPRAYVLPNRIDLSQRDG